MKVLTQMLYWFSVLAVGAIAVLAGIFIGWQIGVAALIAVPVFMCAYTLSDKVAISRRDKYTHSEWGVFFKKMAWAWSTALIVYGLAYIITAYYFGDPMNVLPK